MPTVAEQLRSAREAQGLDVYQVAEITKIKTDHIRALEAGEFDVFIAPVYIRGFVRTYAKSLKLDTAQVMADLDLELSKTEKFSEPPPLMSHPRSPIDFVTLQLSRLNWRVLAAIIGGVLVLILVFVAVRQKSRDPEAALKNLGPGQYEPRPGQTGDKLPLPAAPRR